MVLGRPWRKEGNSKLLFFLSLPSLLLFLLPSVLPLFLSLSVPSLLLPLHQLLPIQTLSIPSCIAPTLHSGDILPCVLAPFFQIPFSLSPIDVFPKEHLSSAERR